MNEAEPSPMSSILQKRQEKLKKKQELIKQLGIPNDIEKIYKEKASKQKKVIFQKVEKKQYYFRSIKESPSPIPEQLPSDVSESEEEVESNIESYLYDSEQIGHLQYTDYVHQAIQSISICKSLLTTEGDTIEQEYVFKEKKLKHIYALSTRDVYGDLFIAGGQGGLISLYSYTHDYDTSLSCYSPVNTYKYHRGWISGLSLKTIQSQPTILSTSNDGYMCYYSLKNTSKPTLLYKSNQIHNSGIFSLSTYKESIFTAGKDATVISSQLANDSISVVHRYEDLFDGIVKGIDSAESCFLAGGLDNTLVLKDIREGSQEDINIQSVHSSMINKCFFSTENSHYIYSTGDDEYVCIYDLRNPSTCYSKLSNHSSSKAIYCPTIIYNSPYLITPSPGTRSLYIYNIYTSELIYTGIMPEEINMITLSNNCPLGNVLYAASTTGSIYTFKPICS